MLGYHIRLRSRNSDHLGTTREARRLVARTVLSQGREQGLVSFGLGGQHLHLFAASDRRGAGELSRRVSLSLYRPLRLEAGFERPYIEPIKDISHAYNTFIYQLRQERRHRLPDDRRGEGSNLPDLLGMRLFGAYTTHNVRRLLPRVDRQRLLAELGVDELEPARGPMDDAVAAGLAAACLPSMRGYGRELRWLRRALIDFYDGRFVDEIMAEQLNISLRSLRRLRSEPADARLVRAIGLQLAAAEALRGRAFGRNEEEVERALRAG